MTQSWPSSGKIKILVIIKIQDCMGPAPRANPSHLPPNPSRNTGQEHPCRDSKYRKNKFTVAKALSVHEKGRAKGRDTFGGWGTEEQIHFHISGFPQVWPECPSGPQHHWAQMTQIDQKLNLLSTSWEAPTPQRQTQKRCTFK